MTHDSDSMIMMILQAGGAGPESDMRPGRPAGLSKTILASPADYPNPKG